MLATGGYGHNAKLSRRLHAAADAGAFDGERIQPGRRHRHRREARRAHRAGGARPQRAVDAGFGHAARRRQQGALPASAARPRQAGPDRGRTRAASASSTKRCRITTLSKRMFDANARAPSIPCYLICDAAFIAKYGLGVVYPGAAQSRAPAAIRISQARRYAGEPRRADRHRRRGRCAARSRATTALRRPASIPISARARPSSNRFNGDEAHTPNPCIGPIAAAPLLRAAKSGPPRSRSAPGCPPTPTRACSTRTGKSIAGLYACGNDMASMMCGSYPGPGTTLGPGMVFAYRAAMHAAGKEPLEEPIAGA